MIIVSGVHIYKHGQNPTKTPLSNSSANVNNGTVKKGQPRTDSDNENKGIMLH